MHKSIDSSVETRTALTPFTIGPIQLRNRLIMAPMTTYSSHEDGTICAEELAYLARRSIGFGAVMTAACHVHPGGKAFDGQWGCDSDNKISSLHLAAEAIHSGGAAAILQIHHGGRRAPARLCGRSVSASDIPADLNGNEPAHAMSTQEIDAVIRAFGDASRRGIEAGFDGIEIHGANTYLLQQFVSPWTNQRTDEYGLDRTLFSRRVTESVLEAVNGQGAVGYRFSPEEPEENGITIENTEALIHQLVRFPLDFLHISLRDFRQTSIRGDFQEPIVPMVNRIIDGRMPLVGVGSIKSLEDAEECLANGADLCAIARSSIIDPDWAASVQKGLQVRTHYPSKNAVETITIPTGLNNRILSTPGWLPTED